MSLKNQNQIVVIKWIDSGGNSRWINEEEALRDEVCVCESVGYLINKDDEKISIIQSKDLVNHTVNALLTIPMVAVQDVKYLRKRG